MKHRITRLYFGCTTEGCPFQLVAFFKGDSDTPVQILGSYASSDGGGQFDVKEGRDIPWVVYEGDWYARKAKPIGVDYTGIRRRVVFEVTDDNGPSRGKWLTGCYSASMSQFRGR